MKSVAGLAVMMLVCACPKGYSQNYHAIHGSSYAASLNVSNNPASILSSPFSWDVTLFGAQLKSATNAFTIYDYSLLSNPAKSLYKVNEGEFGRRADLNFNANLLNARVALGRNSAIAFGANLRGYARLRADPYNYVDTVLDINGFLRINNPAAVYQGRLVNSAWLELFGSYSRTLWDNESSRLNAGITIKANRGISGAHASMQNARVRTEVIPPDVEYTLIDGNVQYGYSSNYDRWQDTKSGQQNIKDFITFTEGSASFDLGLEYLVKTQAVSNFYDEDDYYEYDWKIGLSLLDLGMSKFKYGNKSRIASNPLPAVTSDLMEQKFETVANFQDFNDSLASIAANFGSLGGKYSILHPARMVLNVDRYLVNDFYLNGELSVNLSTLAGDKKWHVQELNLLTITPRWETRRWGGYMPIQLNNAGKFWVGGAFKAGPLLFGVHNLANLVSKKKMQNGGGYLAIILHSWTSAGEKRYKKVDCFR